MFFVLQKIVWFLAMPPASLLLLALLGLVVSRRRRKLGRALICTSLLLLYLLSLPVVADLLLRPLESAAPPLLRPPASADAVVVPGGGSVDMSWAGGAATPNGETLGRLVAGMEIARRMRIPLVLTGGNGEPFATRLRDADVMAATAQALGFPKSQLIVENVSRNTLENSHAVRSLLKGNRIVLATSAYYMQRAAAMFRKRGFEVIPAPTSYLAQARKTGAAQLIPRAGSLAQSTVALAEWMSMAWWGLRGEM